MRTIVEVTLRMTKDEMMKLLEDFIQHGKHQVKVEGGPMVNFVREGNGMVEEGKKASEAAIAAAERGGRLGE